jgi:glycosyltransferase involved in cell wall biosynthesis
MKKILVVVPVYNEEEILEKSVKILHHFLSDHFSQYEWKIIIAATISKDKTFEIGRSLEKKNKQVKFYDCGMAPKSLAIKIVWLSEDADIFCFMDTDLSTDLKYTINLIDAIEREGYDLAIGSRTSEESKTARHFNRRLISITLIFLLNLLFRKNISDYQCGFKAINRQVRDKILPQMKSLKHGFMDTELLLVSLDQGYKIKEIPVSWCDERKSKVRFFGAVIDALASMVRIKLDLSLGHYK